jgi:hypothetical protein
VTEKVLVVPDSSVLHGDHHLTHTSTSILLDYGRRTGLLRMSEVVLDELTNQYREALFEARTKFANIANDLSHLISIPNEYIGSSHLWQTSINNLNVEYAEGKHRDYILNILKESRADVLPYPELTLREVVQRDLSRKKPFDQRGRV